MFYQVGKRYTPAPGYENGRHGGELIKRYPCDQQENCKQECGTNCQGELCFLKEDRTIEVRCAYHDLTPTYKESVK